MQQSKKTGWKHALTNKTEQTKGKSLLTHASSPCLVPSSWGVSFRSNAAPTWNAPMETRNDRWSGCSDPALLRWQQDVAEGWVRAMALGDGEWKGKPWRTCWPPGWLARESLGKCALTSGVMRWCSCRLRGECWDWRLRLHFQFYNHTAPTVERGQNIAQVQAFVSKHPEISLFLKKCLISHSLLNSCCFSWVMHSHF